MLTLEDVPAQVSTSFSFKAALLEGIIRELEDATLDTGPIASNSAHDFEAQEPTGPGVYFATPYLFGARLPLPPSTPTHPDPAEVKLEQGADVESASRVGIKFQAGAHAEFETDVGGEFEMDADGEFEADAGGGFAEGAGGRFETDMDGEFEAHAGGEFGFEEGTDVDPSSDAGGESRRDATAELEYSVFGGESPLSSPQPSRPSSPTKNCRQRRDRERSKARRADKRREERTKAADASRIPKKRATEKFVDDAVKKTTKFKTKNIPSASTGYVATQEKAGGVHTLQELMGMGFELVRWDGRSSKPIVDANGLVIAVLVGQPSDPSWKSAHEDAFALLQEGASRCNFTSKCLQHRRGNFGALNYGISFGGGPQAPGNLCHNKARTEALQHLVDSNCFLRLAGFASSSFSTWMPKLHRHYEACLDALKKRHPHLTPNFKNSIWAAAAFNFGPQTVTGKHRDAANLPFGVCSITALGKFDHTKGGHIALWELKLAIEFPAGSTVLIPSAAISHSNTPIAADELRASFTQYSAGGLFRWVDQGFQKTTQYKKSLSEAEKKRLPDINKARCALGMSLFSTLDELRTPKKKQAPHPAQPDT